MRYMKAGETVAIFFGTLKGREYFGNIGVAGMVVYSGYQRNSV
jgi:hypothetical protein